MYQNTIAVFYGELIEIERVISKLSILRNHAWNKWALLSQNKKLKMHIVAYIITAEYHILCTYEYIYITYDIMWQHLSYFLIKFSIAMEIETQDNAI